LGQRKQKPRKPRNERKKVWEMGCTWRRRKEIQTGIGIHEKMEKKKTQIRLIISTIDNSNYEKVFSFSVFDFEFFQFNFF